MLQQKNSLDGEEVREKKPRIAWPEVAAARYIAPRFLVMFEALCDAFFATARQKKVNAERRFVYVFVRTACRQACWDRFIECGLDSFIWQRFICGRDITSVEQKQHYFKRTILRLIKCYKSGKMIVSRNLWICKAMKRMNKDDY